eukprot:m.24073 g.24073  ORF g.24073 m.24073 type:complete len:306 (-) comp7575_c0_seq1:257-1174(-)
MAYSGLFEAVNPLTHLSHTNLVYLAVAFLTHLYWSPIETAKEVYAQDACKGGFSKPCLDAHMQSWGGVVLMRYLIMGFVVYSTWHFLCYQKSPPVPKVKLNPDYPPVEAHARDKRWTLLGCLIAGCFEVYAVLRWSSGSVPYYESIVAHPLRSVLLWLFAAVWSDVHFYLAHRVLHPWRIYIFGIDPGRYLYKYVHSLHHVATNPGPWSGLAMHPVEHLVYFSRSLWTMWCLSHPVIFMFSNIRATIGPAPGHHGFEDFYGSRFHLLHHTYLECNYGTRGYLDKIFGTYRDHLGSNMLQKQKKGS